MRLVDQWASLLKPKEERGSGGYFNTFAHGCHSARPALPWRSERAPAERGPVAAPDLRSGAGRRLSRCEAYQGKSAKTACGA